MTIDAIAAIGAAQAADPATMTLLAPAPVAPPAGAFGTWFASELGQVNATLARADNDIQKLAVGEAPSLHEVMIHLEEAKLSFQLLAQVRNRLLESYQEVMRMQV
jgi:flagellar hook-basal body complex protein FliE